MSSRQHSPKASKPFAKSPTLWLAGVSRSLEEPKNRRAVFSILALLTGLVALTALFETENQLFPVQRSLIPINADQIYRRVWNDPWNSGTSSASSKSSDGSNNTFTARQSKPKVIIEGKRDKSNQKDLTRSWQGVLSVVVFVCGYALAIAEELSDADLRNRFPLPSPLGSSGY